MENEKVEIRTQRLFRVMTKIVIFDVENLTIDYELNAQKKYCKIKQKHVNSVRNALIDDVRVSLLITRKAKYVNGKIAGIYDELTDITLFSRK